MTGQWLLYGAYGTAGKRIIETYRDLKLPAPIIAGRNPDKLEKIAKQYGLEQRCFALDDAAAMDAALSSVNLVLLCAGPYSMTSAPVVAACLRTGTHYLDITGEVSVFQACQDKDLEARDKGIVIMPSVGQDIVPTDCLALWLKDQLPDATDLDLALIQTGSPPSAGTVKTSLEGLAKGNYICGDGEMTKVCLGHRTEKVAFADETRVCQSIPLADVFSANWSTGIPNVTMFGAMPRRAVYSARVARPLLRTGLGLRLAQRLVEKFVPDSVPEDNTTSQFWGQVSNQHGQTVAATLT